jgi:hypothetical protein
MALQHRHTPIHLSALAILLVLFVGDFLNPGHIVFGDTAKTISYALASSGRVSLAVYDAHGRIVRTLLAAVTQSAGDHHIVWDGKDDSGNNLPRGGQYTWKLLQTPGLTAHYVLSMGSTFPFGTRTDYAGGYPRLWWEQTLGNHAGPRSVAADETGIYVGSGVSEIAPNALKMSLDGAKRIWSANQVKAWIGRYSLDVMDGWLYSLGQDAKVYAHERDNPNVGYQSVGSGPNYVGINWDALFPGDTRPRPDYWSASVTAQSMDLAARHVGNVSQLVLSYMNHDIVQWRDPQTGVVLDSVAVPAPAGVAIGNAGEVLAISQGKIFKFTRANKNLVTVVSGLSSPWRLAVDPVAGDILVVEHGTSQQIKRYSSGGVLLASYGKMGGRKLGGAYDSTEGFRDLLDIAIMPNQDILAVENPDMSPRRVMRLSKDGVLVREWYGSARWTRPVAPDPEDPTLVWYEDGGGGDLVLAKVDYTNKSWTIKATYGSLFVSIDGFDGDLFYDQWRVRKHEGKTYVLNEMKNTLAVALVNETTGKLQPCTVVSYGEGYGKDGVQTPASMWVDQNGDGIKQIGETTTYNGWGWYGWRRGSFRVESNSFNYVGYDVAEGRLYRVNITGWSAAGCPIYEDIRKADATPWGEQVAEIKNPLGEYLASPNLAPDANGDVLAAINSPLVSWGNPTWTRVVRWNSSGKVVWVLNNMAPRNPNMMTTDHSGDVPPPAGKVYAFRTVVGITHNSIIANDYDGGWDSVPNPITYVWDRDGLWVGGLFDNIDLSAAPREYYNLSSDNLVGDIWTDPATGDVYYFGTGGAGDCNPRIYRISGWNGWVRQSGIVRK